MTLHLYVLLHLHVIFVCEIHLHEHVTFACTRHWFYIHNLFVTLHVKKQHTFDCAIILKSNIGMYQCIDM